VGKFGFEDEEHIINDFQPGPVSKRLFGSLTDIQYGRVADPYGWTLKIKG